MNILFESYWIAVILIEYVLFIKMLTCILDNVWNHFNILNSGIEAT